MKSSQKVLLTTLGTVLCLIVAFAILARSTLNQMEHPPELKYLADIKLQDMRDFNAIKADGNWDIELSQGDTWQIKLDYPEALAKDLQVYVFKQQLYLRHKKNDWWQSNPPLIKAVIIMPALTQLSVAGAGNVHLSGFTEAKTQLSLAGAVALQGQDSRFEELEITVAGSSKLTMPSVTATDANINLAGSSSVTLTMDGGSLTGSIAGSGNIYYYGEVSTSKIDIMGNGNVKELK